MRSSFFITCLLLITCLLAHAQDSLFRRSPTNAYAAAEQIKALKKGALVVRLKTNDKSLEAYRKAGQNELADKIVAERQVLNQKIVDAFKYYFTFCPVYFIYAKNTDALLKREPNIFLDPQLKPDTSIKLKDDFFLIAEYGSYTSNERVDEYHYSGVYKTEPSNSTASTSALVILDTTLTQLQEPFPFYVPVYLGGFIKGASQMSSNLEKAYFRVLNKEMDNTNDLKRKGKRGK